jgi:2,5-diketo-D-gluconate reductase B
MTIEPTVAGIPQMGYGTWNRPGDEAYNGVIWALEAGCRYTVSLASSKHQSQIGKFATSLGSRKSITGGITSQSGNLH